MTMFLRNLYTSIAASYQHRRCSEFDRWVHSTRQRSFFDMEAMVSATAAAAAAAVAATVAVAAARLAFVLQN